MRSEEFCPDSIAMVGKVAAKDCCKMEVTPVIAAHVVNAAANGCCKFVEKCKIHRIRRLEETLYISEADSFLA